MFLLVLAHLQHAQQFFHFEYLISWILPHSHPQLVDASVAYFYHIGRTIK